MTLQIGDASASVEYYGDLARTLAPAYDSVTFEQANAGVSEFLPPAPSLVLDVGAGSGRDARAMAAMGHEVVAVEPSPAFRVLAARDGECLTWVDDRLPDLPVVSATGRSFGFILCSAVLMLLPPEDLAHSFAALQALLARRGRLAISLRAPAAGEPRQVFHAHSDGEMAGFARAASLEVVHRATPGDALGRPAMVWRSFVFARSDEGAMEAVGPIPD